MKAHKTEMMMCLIWPWKLQFKKRIFIKKGWRHNCLTVPKLFNCFVNNLSEIILDVLL